MLNTFSRIAGFDAASSWTFWAVLISIVYLVLAITSVISAYQMHASNDDFDAPDLVTFFGRVLAVLIFISWLIST